MNDASRSQEQPASESRRKAKPADQRQEVVDHQSRGSDHDATSQGRETTKASIKQGTVTKTAGRNGERHLKVEWLYVWITSIQKTCHFSVTTAAGNGLEVVIEQLAYRKVHSGTGSLITELVPVAEAGTLLKVIARDTTTGEQTEESGYWYTVGYGADGLLTRIWRAVKEIFSGGTNG